MILVGSDLRFIYNPFHFTSKMDFKAKVFQNKRTKQLIIMLSKKKLECLIKKKKLEMAIPKYIQIKKKNLIF